MEKIIWDDEFSIGAPEMDRQHQRIIKMLNRLLDTQSATTTSETVSDILSDMTQYAKDHFSSEEALLEETGYPDLENHQRLHLAYWKKTAELCRDTVFGARYVPEELLVYLQHWWRNHILIEDMKYKTFMKSRHINN